MIACTSELLGSPLLEMVFLQMMLSPADPRQCLADGLFQGPSPTGSVYTAALLKKFFSTNMGYSMPIGMDAQQCLVY